MKLRITYHPEWTPNGWVTSASTRLGVPVEVVLGDHRGYRAQWKDSEKTLSRETLLHMQRAALGIMNETHCPDPGEGGCIGGPIPGFGCVHEAASAIARVLNEVLEP